MQNKANSLEDYIHQAPKERQIVIKKLRETISQNLPKGFEEGVQYRMIAYYVPHEIYPEGYHCNPKEPLPFMSFASQKSSVNLYHMGLYAVSEIYDWFVNEYPKFSSRKLDMGKSCIRFKKVDDIPYELIAALCKKLSVKEWITVYENNIKK
ncbi:MAG: DUF1801 domain-containing protein [Polaribacter sp.]